MLIDSHAHYDDKRYDGDRDEAVMKAYESGVDIIINAGSNMESSRESIGLAEKYAFIYATAGIHPHDAAAAPADAIEQIEAMCGHPKVVAIGEIGLDYHYDFSPRDVQKELFVRQMKLAAKLRMPVIVHDREAHADVMGVLKLFPSVKGVIHNFSGDAVLLGEALDMGYYISLGGAATFANAKKPVAAAEAVPLDKLLLETDAPYMTPHPFRGKRNSSEFMIHTAEKIAEIKKMDAAELCGICADNTMRLFRIASGE